MSQIKDALANKKNPSTSFDGSGDPARKREVANVLALLLSNLDSLGDLGSSHDEISVNIGQLLDSFD